MAAECGARQQIAAGSGALEPESQAQKSAPTVETTSPLTVGSMSPDISAEEESLMIEALLEYEKREEEETKDTKNIQ